jgi:hypothetical protein
MSDGIPTNALPTIEITIAGSNGKSPFVNTGPAIKISAYPDLSKRVALLYIKERLAKELKPALDR